MTELRHGAIFILFQDENLFRPSTYIIRTRRASLSFQDIASDAILGGVSISRMMISTIAASPLNFDKDAISFYKRTRGRFDAEREKRMPDIAPVPSASPSHDAICRPASPPAARPARPPALPSFPPSLCVCCFRRGYHFFFVVYRPSVAQRYASRPALFHADATDARLRRDKTILVFFMRYKDIICRARKAWLPVLFLFIYSFSASRTHRRRAARARRRFLSGIAGARRALIGGCGTSGWRHYAAGAMGAAGLPRHISAERAAYARWDTYAHSRGVIFDAHFYARRHTAINTTAPR